MSARKQNRQQLLKRFDTNQDGEVDQTEWESAREAALLVVHQQLQHEPEIHHVSCSKDHHRPFMISIHPQTELIQKYRHHTFIMLMISCGMMSCVIWLLQMYG